MKMDASIYIIEVTDGPFIIQKKNGTLLKASCAMQLIDYNNCLAYDNEIFVENRGARRLKVNFIQLIIVSGFVSGFVFK
jgi:hypothetical protein